MTRIEMDALFRYSDWADDRLLNMLAAAFGEEADLRRGEARVRAIQETAVHLLSAQVIWRSRWEGVSPQAMLDPAAYPTVSTLREAFAEERARRHRLWPTLTSDADLLRIIHSKSTTGEPRVFPLWQMLLQMILHGAYHRGQVTVGLLDLDHGATLLTTDLIAFYLEQQAQAET